MNVADKENLLRFGPFKEVFKGLVFTIKQREVFYPDGRKKVFEYCQRFDSVNVLAFDEQGRLLLTREFRENGNRYMWFLPAGKIDKGENPLLAAQRELREETGFKALTWRLISDNPAPSSYFIWRTFVYAAKDLAPAPLSGDEFFPIEVVPTPLEKAVEMAVSGKIENVFLAFNIIYFNYLLQNNKWQW